MSLSHTLDMYASLVYAVSRKHFLRMMIIEIPFTNQSNQKVYFSLKNYNMGVEFPTMCSAILKCLALWPCGHLHIANPSLYSTQIFMSYAPHLESQSEVDTTEQVIPLT